MLGLAGERDETVWRWRSALFTGALAFLAISALLYARRFDYNLYLFNKSVAGTAVVLIGLSYLLGPLARFLPRTFVPLLYSRKYLGVLGFGTAALHALLSLVMLTPTYYPSLFTSAGKLTPTGELSMALGALALFAFAGVAITSLPGVEASMNRERWLLIQRTGYGAFLVAMAHFFLLKWPGWYDPANWLNNLPPASLVVAVFAVLVLLARVSVILFPGEIHKPEKFAVRGKLRQPPRYNS